MSSDNEENRQLKYKTERVRYLLNHKFDSFRQHMTKGVVVGCALGASFGVAVPFVIKNTNRVHVFIKSVANMALLSSGYQLTTYSLDRTIAIPPTATASVAGALSCGVLSTFLGSSVTTATRGAMIGGLVCCATNFIYRSANDLTNHRTLRDNYDKLAEIKYLLANYNIHLSPEESKLFDDLNSNTITPSFLNPSQQSPSSSSISPDKDKSIDN